MSPSPRPSFADELTRWSYSLLLILFMPVMLLHWLMRLAFRSEGYSVKHRQRFGWLPQNLPKQGLLVHCVSMGEVTAAAPLIREIQRRHPQLPVTLTTTTATGAAQVERMFGDTVRHLYLPYDLPWMMAHLLGRLAPQQILITEVELWPNMVHQAWQRDIPVTVINARMTDKSSNSYQKLGRLFRPMLAKLQRVCAQGNRDFDNYLALGLDEDKLILSGNLKFDLPVPDIDADRDALLKAFNPNGQPLLLGASTHEPEESLLLEAYSRLKPKYADLKLLLVPRHPQRFDAVAKLCEQAGFNFTRSSTLAGSKTDILLVDQMGVLSKLYGIADMAFVGGSLAERGGHNPLEAAVFGVPVMMGPSRHNNPQICGELAQRGAVVEVNTAMDIENQVATWLDQPNSRTQAGEMGLSVIADNRGAIQRTLAALEL